MTETMRFQRGDTVSYEARFLDGETMRRTGTVAHMTFDGLVCVRTDEFGGRYNFRPEQLTKVEAEMGQRR